MKKPFLSALIFYLFSAAIIFPYVRWYADNPDTFQYLAIAKKYISGDWSHAVNGYWSPVISWLLIIPLIFFKDPILAFKVLQFLTGVFVLWQWHKLLNQTTLQKSLQNILLFAIIPFLLDYSLLNLTPDLLFIGVLFMLLNYLIPGDIFTNWSKAFKIGLTGSLLYLTKAFGFPFFIVLTLVFVFFLLKKQEQKQSILKNIIKLYGIFLLVSFSWILILSLHYGHFTISEAARFNLSREAAPLPGRSSSLPILNKGLNEPLSNSFSAWESPGEYVGNERVTPFHLTADYLQIIRRNLLSIYYFDFRHQVGIFFILLLFLFLIIIGRSELLKQRWILICLFSVFLLYAGYSLILVHSRYTWVNSLLMMLMSVYFIRAILDSQRFRIIFVLSIIFILLLSVKRPVKEILFTKDKNFPPGWILKSLIHPFETLWIFYKPDIELQKSSDEIKSNNVLNGNVASLKNMDADRDSYTNALRISQNSNCRYFGQLDDEENLNLQEDELKEMNINFLITLKNTQWGNRAPVYQNEEAGIRIYKLN